MMAEVLDLFGTQFNNVTIHVVLGLIMTRMVVYLTCQRPKSMAKQLCGKHVLVTGGSSGIGKEMALLASRCGAHVTIVARNIEKLEEAVLELRAAAKSGEQEMKYVSLDCTNYELVSQELLRVDGQRPINILVNCAGIAIAGRLEDLSNSDIFKMTETNYYGTVFPIKVLVPKMKQRAQGTIILTGSVCSLFGIFGYTVYAGTKFALRGFAECLDMEVRPHNITVTLAVPPDTDTPGYVNECLTKPMETHKISELDALHKPDTVARNIMRDALRGEFFSYVGFSGFILTSICSGFAPLEFGITYFIHILILGPLRLFTLIVHKICHRIVADCDRKRKQEVTALKN